MDLEIHYRNPPPTIRRFLDSGAFIRGIRGPIGSGKSTACCYEIMRRACEQAPASDGIARTRWTVVRNTYPELQTTTIRTWHGLVPKEFGRFYEQGPPRHVVKFQHDAGHIVECEVIFLALDSAINDIGKVLSLEITGAWLNEAREIPKGIVDALTGRVGRYPGPIHGGATWAGLILDTNPPDADHWWHTLAERDTTTPDNRDLIASLDEAESELRRMGVLSANQPLFEFFSQPSGRSEHAENIANLRPGYYQFAMAGKDADWIKVYVDGEYGFVRDGKPVYPEYHDSVHCQPFELDKRTGLSIGLDFGLTPAAIIGQRTPSGRVLWRWELVSEDMGVARFGGLLAQKIRALEQEGYWVESITGDPAGEARDYREETAFQVLSGAGIKAKPANTNEWTIRRDSVASLLSKLIDGEPGLIVHPECAVTRKGMAGGYNLRRLKVAGDERYQDKPEKNKFSHVCEAGQYQVLGVGEGKAMVRPLGRTKLMREPRATTDYDVFG